MLLRLLIAIASFLVVVNETDADQRDAVPDAFSSRVLPVLKRHCTGCHGAEEMESGVRLDQIEPSVREDQLKLLSAIRKQLHDRLMPPEGESQPTPQERATVIRWIDQAQEIARSRPVPKNGSVRRLTTAQYQNTLQELLLLDEDVTDVLPPEAVSRDGFVNNVATLNLSPVRLETYFDVAEKALTAAIVDADTTPTIQRFRVDFGEAVNPSPLPDPLILGANSALLPNANFRVTQPVPDKSFPFEPFKMRTRYRFIEGYQGNATVRGWRDYDNIYHAVFACMRGTPGYPKGLAHECSDNGLLLRPAIPSAEVFGVSNTYGPKANFKIALRELPDHGRFRITVTASKYADGLLLDQASPRRGANQETHAVELENGSASFPVQCDGIYQVDLHSSDELESSDEKQNVDVTLKLDDRVFSGKLRRPAFIALRLSSGEVTLSAKANGKTKIERVVLTRLAEDDAVAAAFLEFENRSPLLGVHLGLRRDCGSTLNPVGNVSLVTDESPNTFVFEGAIRNFPSPDVQDGNVNYLAGVREIGIRHEWTNDRDVPRLMIHSVEFEGPYYETWPPKSHRNLIPDLQEVEDKVATCHETLRSFAERAFRRPLTLDEIDTLCRQFDAGYAESNDLQRSLVDSYQVILTSPQFLYLTEVSRSPDGEPITEYELASKLSYFLWNGPPDETLLRLADEGALNHQLDQQVDRMIADEKFTRFAKAFSEQWLGIERFDVLEPDVQQYPMLTPIVRNHLRNEPAAFFQYVVRQNRPISELVSSDYLVVNDVVAHYYLLDNPPNTGFQFAPVPLSQRHLGGLLTQASILAGLSDGREGSPVKRGAWIARKIIAEPPGDPPPLVPELAEDTTGLSFRERLAKHRDHAGCAQCHAKIDPWGIPFEQYDAGGKRRQDVIDASATLPDATHVSGVEELKHYLKTQRLDQVTYSVTQHLATYAIGRDLTYREQTRIREDLAGESETGIRMRDLIRYIVHSPAFLEK